MNKLITARKIKLLEHDLQSRRALHHRNANACLERVDTIEKTLAAIQCATKYNIYNNMPDEDIDKFIAEVRREFDIERND